MTSKESVTESSTKWHELAVRANETRDEIPVSEIFELQ